MGIREFEVPFWLWIAVAAIIMILIFGFSWWVYQGTYILSEPDAPGELTIELEDDGRSLYISNGTVSRPEDYYNVSVIFEGNPREVDMKFRLNDANSTARVDSTGVSVEDGALYHDASIPNGTKFNIRVEYYSESAAQTVVIQNQYYELYQGEFSRLER